MQCSGKNVCFINVQMENHKKQRVQAFIWGAWVGSAG